MTPDSIPLLLIPVLNRGDLLVRAVRAIDHPVDRLLIVVNSTDASVVRGVADLLNGPGYDIACLEILHHCGRNLGVAPSWNLGMRRLIPKNPTDWCLFMGNDIEVAPGDLAKIAAAVRDNPDAGRVCANHGYSLFAVTGLGRATVGLFDENFRPAYLEDCDYDWRVHLSGLRKVEVPGCGAVHGDGKLTGSCTIHSDPVLRERNGVTHGNNFVYYRRKWGGVNGEEKFTNPFNDPAWPLDRWEHDAAHAHKNSLW